MQIKEAIEVIGLAVVFDYRLPFVGLFLAVRAGDADFLCDFKAEQFGDLLIVYIGEDVIVVEHLFSVNDDALALVKRIAAKIAGADLRARVLVVRGARVKVKAVARVINVNHLVTPFSCKKFLRSSV
jgi:hypothetical protein